MSRLAAPRFTQWFRLLAVVAIGCSLLVAGCTSRLIVETQPPGAIVSVSDAEGKMLRSGPSPLLAELALPEDGSQRYVIEVLPTTDQAERYYGDRAELTTSDYYTLPEDDVNGRVLSFTLLEKDYVNLPVVEVTLTPRGRWVGVASKSRSYKDIGEAGAQVPTRIVDFGENRGIQGLALSPDGQRIVYSEAVYERRLEAPGAAAGPRVYELKGANLRGINIEGGGVQHITTDDFQDMFPSFTPPEFPPLGELILFSSNRRGDRLSILGIRSAGRSGISNIYVNHPNGIPIKPTAGGDGTIAFAVAQIDPVRNVVTDSQVWTHYGPNEYPTQITQDGGRDPAISPDGRRVAYIHPETGNLMVIDADGGNSVELTSGAASIVERLEAKLSAAESAALNVSAAPGYDPVSAYRSPSWTPDGESILFTSMEGVDPEGRPNEDVWIIDADGGAALQLTTNGSVDRYPLMSPDGQYIYFLSNRGESWGVWRVAHEAAE